MNTVIILRGPIDFGTGESSDRVTLVDTTYTVTDGHLHVYRKDGELAAAFAPGEWRSVVRGDLESESLYDIKTVAS